MKKIIVSPSVLNANYLNLGQEINKIKEAGMTWIHFDVMDGVFVPNISFGSVLLDKIADKVDLIKDVHIMIDDPLEKIQYYTNCGADYLTFHYEACQDDAEVEAVIDKIHSFGIKAGLSIKPNTSISKVYPFLNKLDLVLIMSVEPGYGGQKFISLSLNKISELRHKIDEVGLATLISVDGGINDVTAKDCINSGVDVLVVGQYLFGHEDFFERYQRLIK